MTAYNEGLAGPELDQVTADILTEGSFLEGPTGDNVFDLHEVASRVGSSALYAESWGRGSSRDGRNPRNDRSSGGDSSSRSPRPLTRSEIEATYETHRTPDGDFIVEKDDNGDPILRRERP